MEGTQLDFNALAQLKNRLNERKAALSGVKDAFKSDMDELANGPYTSPRGQQTLRQVSTEFSSNMMRMLEPVSTLIEKIEEAQATAERRDQAHAQTMINELRSDR